MHTSTKRSPFQLEAIKHFKQLRREGRLPSTDDGFFNRLTLKHMVALSSAVKALLVLGDLKQAIGDFQPHFLNLVEHHEQLIALIYNTNKSGEWSFFECSISGIKEEAVYIDGSLKKILQIPNPDQTWFVDRQDMQRFEFEGLLYYWVQQAINTLNDYRWAVRFLGLRELSQQLQSLHELLCRLRMQPLACHHLKHQQQPAALPNSTHAADLKWLLNVMNSFRHQMDVNQQQHYKHMIAIVKTAVSYLLFFLFLTCRYLNLTSNANYSWENLNFSNDLERYQSYRHGSLATTLNRIQQGNPTDIQDKLDQGLKLLKHAEQSQLNSKQICLLCETLFYMVEHVQEQDRDWNNFLNDTSGKLSHTDLMLADEDVLFLNQETELFKLKRDDQDGLQVIKPLPLMRSKSDSAINATKAQSAPSSLISMRSAVSKMMKRCRHWFAEEASPQERHSEPTFSWQRLSEEDRTRICQSSSPSRLFKVHLSRMIDRYSDVDVGCQMDYSNSSGS